jgi:hypothetical protein
MQETCFALVRIGESYEQWFAFENRDHLVKVKATKWQALANWLDEPLKGKVHRKEVNVKVMQLTLDWAPSARAILFVSDSGKSS